MRRSCASPHPHAVGVFTPESNMRAFVLCLVFCCGCATTAALLAKTSDAVKQAVDATDAVRAQLEDVNALVCSPEHVVPEIVDECADAQEALHVARKLGRAARAAAAVLDADAGVE